MKLPIILAALACLVPAQALVAGEAPEGSAPVALQPDPVQAAALVQRALRQSATEVGQVIVSTHADTIILTGEVGSEMQASRAVAIAGQAAGGLRVSSQLQVRAGSGASQQQAVALVREVEKALRGDSRTADLGISVSIDDSQVIGLHGLVPSLDSRRLAEDVAGRVAGVKRVRSHLVVPGE